MCDYKKFIRKVSIMNSAKIVIKLIRFYKEEFLTLFM